MTNPPYTGHATKPDSIAPVVTGHHPSDRSRGLTVEQLTSVFPIVTVFAVVAAGSSAPWRGARLCIDLSLGHS